MLDEYLQHLIARRRSPNTVKVRAVYLRQLQTVKPLTTVTPADLDRILATHVDDWKPGTVNVAITSWRSFFRWAIRNGHITDDPTRDLEYAHVPRIVQTLADDTRVLGAIDETSIRNRAMLLLGRELGLRRNEIATLRKTDRTGARLHVTGKGGVTRHLKIESATLLDDLITLEGSNSSEFYFLGRSGGHISTSAVYKIVTDLIGTSPHSLRRTCLTAVYEGTGNDIRTTQEFAGHSDPATTAIYIAVTDNRMIAAAQAARLAA